MTESSHALSPLRGLGILLAVVIVIGVFIALAMTLGVHEMWAGFLFLLCWTLVEKGGLKGFQRALFGALVGAGLATLLKLLPLWIGLPGMLLFLGILLVVIYAQIMGLFTIAINSSAMVFLTAGSIPHIQTNLDTVTITNMFTGLACGAIFFGAIGLFVTQVGQRLRSA